MAKEQEGFQYGSDCDGDTIVYGWGTTFASSAVMWKSELACNRPEGRSLFATRQEALDNLAATFDRQIEEFDLQLRHMKQALADLKSGKKKLLQTGDAEVSPHVNMYAIKQKAAQELEVRREKAQLRQRLKELERS